MNEQHVKGPADKVKGAMKDADGTLIGDKQMQAEGKVGNAKGAARSTVGDIEDTIREAADRAEHPPLDR